MRSTYTALFVNPDTTLIATIREMIKVIRAGCVCSLTVMADSWLLLPSLISLTLPPFLLPAIVDDLLFIVKCFHRAFGWCYK